MKYDERTIIQQKEHNMVTPDFLKRYEGNPILSAKDIPYEAVLIFNAGICKYQGKYVMCFRNDYGLDEEEFRIKEHPVETNIGIALSDDGIHWTPGPKPVFQLADDEIIRAYDPRLTVVDGQALMCFAVDTRHGLRGGVAATDDFEHFEIKSLSAPDNRNMVIFPEKINGKYFRLERPFPIYSRGAGEKFDIWSSDSPDLCYWGNTKLVLGGERVPFANAKIGPAAPPVKTPRGWLTTFHGVKFVERELPAWHSNWHKVYYAGLMLLDLNDPSKVIGMGRTPLIAPEAEYECKGFRGEVIFPGGMILEDSGEVKIYYGAADTVECLATANVDDLLGFCEPV